METFGEFRMRREFERQCTTTRLMFGVGVFVGLLWGGWLTHIYEVQQRRELQQELQAIREQSEAFRTAYLAVLTRWEEEP